MMTFSLWFGGLKKSTAVELFDIFFFFFFNFVSGFRAHHSPLFDAFFFNNGAGSCQGREDTTRKGWGGGRALGVSWCWFIACFAKKGYR